MNRNNDETLRQKFKELPDLPFSNELQQRILAETASNRQSPVDKSHPRKFWKPWLAAASGVAAAAVVLTAVIVGPVHSQRQSTAQLQSFQAYGLEPAKLQVVSTQIGTIPGHPTDSSVIALIKNTGSKPIAKNDVFGVLAFPAETASKTLLQSDSLTFVNGPDQAIQPGQTVKWMFHPVGAPHDAKTMGLTEQPYLVFFKDGLQKTSAHGQHSNQQTVTSTPQAVWQKSPVEVQNVTVAPKHHGTGWQSLTVHAVLKNTTDLPININQLWAVTWYNQGSNNKTHQWDWSSPGDIRFMNHLQSNQGNHIAPGQQLDVYFDIVGSSQSSLQNLQPQVVILKR